MASWQYGPDGARGHAKYLGEIKPLAFNRNVRLHFFGVWGLFIFLGICHEDVGIGYDMIIT